MKREQFDVLRAANIKRLAEWPGGELITPSFRGLELVGEVGELANLLKKLTRLRLGIFGTRDTEDTLLRSIADELGDVVICLDLIGMELAQPLMRPKVRDDVKGHSGAEPLVVLGNWLAYRAADLAAEVSLKASWEKQVRIDLSLAFCAAADLAKELEIDLWRCTRDKFNATTRKQGLNTIIRG